MIKSHTFLFHNLSVARKLSYTTHLWLMILSLFSQSIWAFIISRKYSVFVHHLKKNIKPTISLLQYICIFYHMIFRWGWIDFVHQKPWIRTFNTCFRLHNIHLEFTTCRHKCVFKVRNSCCAWGISSLEKHVFRLFWNKWDDYSYLYIRNLKNSRLKQVYRYTISI